VADLIGAERLLFGSDFPLLVARRYREAFAAAGLTQPEELLVMGGAAKSFFGL
jgi:predicted TIM-barrel fold metal-dependent hydrolase